MKMMVSNSGIKIKKKKKKPFVIDYYAFVVP